MAKTIYESKTVAEVVKFLLEERHLSYRELGEQLGVSQTTVGNLVNASKRPDPETCDKLAAFAGLTREFVYELAYNIKTHPGYSRSVAEIAAILENAPPDIQDAAAAAIRAMVAARKQPNK